jgi:hypothetical protein
MLQKNPGLTQAQIEAILKSTTLPLPPGCRTFVDGFFAHGKEPTWSDPSSVTFAANTMCWGTDATGAGLVRAAAALAATPLP